VQVALAQLGIPLQIIFVPYLNYYVFSPADLCNQWLQFLILSAVRESFHPKKTLLDEYNA
jgi:hypothetical protein